jgi:hypothetical protein
VSCRHYRKYGNGECHGSRRLNVKSLTAGIQRFFRLVVKQMLLLLKLLLEFGKFDVGPATLRLHLLQTSLALPLARRFCVLLVKNGK